MKRSALLAPILLVGLAGCGGVIAYEGSYVVVKAPADDESLRKWFEEQPGVRDVNVTREGKTVRVRYSRDVTHRELNHPAPPFNELGYEVSGFGGRISGTNRLMAGVPDWVVVILAVVAVTTTIEGIRWLLRRKETAEPLSRPADLDKNENLGAG
jgi:hypothetical protein